MSEAEIVVIVPTFNERENVEEILARIFAVAGEQCWNLEALIVDDRSPDGTADLARSEAEKYSGRARVLERSGARGLAVAVVDGMRHTDAPIVAVMDADLSHPPESLPALIEPIRAGSSDFVVGSRYVEGGATVNWGFHRRLNSCVATALCRPLCNLRDPLAGFFAFSRRVAPPPDALSPTGYKIGLELLVKSRCENVLEVPIEFQDRARGHSKLGVREQVNYLRHLARLYRFKYLTARTRESR